MAMAHPAPFTGRWRGSWIWSHSPQIGLDNATRPVLSDPVDQVALLRRTFSLSDVPDVAPCRVWVDGRYHLRVNGVEVARGPVRSDPRRSHYDVVDLAPKLRRGENVLALTARHYGTARSWWMPVPPTYSLGGGSAVLEARIGDDWIVSDGSWHAEQGEAWSSVDVPGDIASLPLENFDARSHPHGWDLPGFDDGTWSTAAVVPAMHTGGQRDPHPPSAPFGMLGPPVRSHFPGGHHHDAELIATRSVIGTEPVDDPVVQVRADAASGISTDDGPGTVTCLAFDLGHIAAGNLLLTVQGAAEGTVLDIAASERVDADGRPASPQQHAGLRYTCRGVDDEFESFDLVGARYLHCSVRSPEPYSQARVGLAVQDRLRPRPKGSSFVCSDPLLDEVYTVGLRTVDVCALDAYVDCPTREQRAWTGDSVVHQMVDLVTNPDWSMAIWHPQLAASPRPDRMLPMAAASDFAFDDRSYIPDWALHWVRSVHNLYRYTGDRELVAELLPVAESTLRWFEAFLGPDDLLHDVAGWCLIDWASVYSSGCSSVMNALWARALEDLAEMADWIGNAGTARWARNRLEGVRSGFDAFWDDTRGVYVDHLMDGARRAVAAQHAGATALAAGLVPSDRTSRVIERLLDRGRLIRHSWVMDTTTVDGDGSGYLHLINGYPEPTWDVEEQMVEAEPFFRYVLHDGLARAGRADLVAGLCRNWSVFLDDGETTWPEVWVGGTRCHGWSSTPTRDLMVHVLGVSPAEPGYGSVRVSPALGDLEWAKGRVPTPHGFVSVEARGDGTVEVDSPVPVVRD